MPFNLTELWTVSTKYLFTLGRKVGIETKNPKYTLDVNGVINAENIKEQDQDLEKKYLQVSDRDKNTDIIIGDIANQYTDDNLRQEYIDHLQVRFRFDIDRYNDSYYFKNDRKGVSSVSTTDLRNYNLKPFFKDSSNKILEYGKKYIIGNSSAYFNKNQYFRCINDNNLIIDNTWNTIGQWTIMMWCRFTDETIDFLNGIGNEVVLYEIRNVNTSSGEINYSSKTHYLKLKVSDSKKFEIEFKTPNLNIDRYQTKTVVEANYWYHVSIAMINVGQEIRKVDFDDLFNNKYKKELTDYYSQRETSTDANIIYETGDDLRIYINGVEESDRDGRFPYFDHTINDNFISTLGASIDTNGNPTNLFSGYIDDFRVYNQTMTQLEISEFLIGNVLLLTPNIIRNFGNPGIFLKPFEDKIGIGTKNPTEKLHVVGNTLIEGNLIIDSGYELVANAITIDSNISCNSTILGDLIVEEKGIISNIDAKYADIEETHLNQSYISDSGFLKGKNFIIGKELVESDYDIELNCDIFVEKLTASTNILSNIDVLETATIQQEFIEHSTIKNLQGSNVVIKSNITMNDETRIVGDIYRIGIGTTEPSRCIDVQDSLGIFTSNLYSKDIEADKITSLSYQTDNSITTEINSGSINTQYSSIEETNLGPSEDENQYILKSDYNFQDKFFVGYKIDKISSPNIYQNPEYGIYKKFRNDNGYRQDTDYNKINIDAGDGYLYTSNVETQVINISEELTSKKINVSEKFDYTDLLLLESDTVYIGDKENKESVSGTINIYKNITIYDQLSKIEFRDSTVNRTIEKLDIERGSVILRNGDIKLTNGSIQFGNLSDSFLNKEELNLNNEIILSDVDNRVKFGNFDYDIRNNTLTIGAINCTLLLQDGKRLTVQEAVGVGERTQTSKGLLFHKQPGRNDVKPTDSLGQNALRFKLDMNDFSDNEQFADRIITDHSQATRGAVDYDNNSVKITGDDQTLSITSITTDNIFCYSWLKILDGTITNIFTILRSSLDHITLKRNGTVLELEINNMMTLAETFVHETGDNDIINKWLFITLRRYRIQGSTKTITKMTINGNLIFDIEYPDSVEYNSGLQLKIYGGILYNCFDIYDAIISDTKLYSYRNINLIYDVNGINAIKKIAYGYYDNEDGNRIINDADYESTSIKQSLVSDKPYGPDELSPNNNIHTLDPVNVDLTTYDLIVDFNIDKTVFSNRVGVNLLSVTNKKNILFDLQVNDLNNDIYDYFHQVTNIPSVVIGSTLNNKKNVSQVYDKVRVLALSTNTNKNDDAEIGGNAIFSLKSLTNNDLKYDSSVSTLDPQQKAYNVELKIGLTYANELTEKDIIGFRYHPTLLTNNAQVYIGLDNPRGSYALDVKGKIHSDEIQISGASTFNGTSTFNNTTTTVGVLNINNTTNIDGPATFKKNVNIGSISDTSPITTIYGNVIFGDSTKTIAQQPTATFYGSTEFKGDTTFNTDTVSFEKLFINKPVEVNPPNDVKFYIKGKGEIDGTLEVSTVDVTTLTVTNTVNIGTNGNNVETTIYGNVSIDGQMKSTNYISRTAGRSSTYIYEGNDGDGYDHVFLDRPGMYIDMTYTAYTVPGSLNPTGGTYSDSFDNRKKYGIVICNTSGRSTNNFDQNYSIPAIGLTNDTIKAIGRGGNLHIEAGAGDSSIQAGKVFIENAQITGSLSGNASQIDISLQSPSAGNYYFTMTSTEATSTVSGFNLSHLNQGPYILYNAGSDNYFELKNSKINYDKLLGVPRVDVVKTQTIHTSNPFEDDNAVKLHAVSGGVKIKGALDVSQDITAFSSQVTSDRRLKKNIKPLSNGIDIINQLEPVEYQWNEKTSEKLQNKQEVGLIAQDVEKLLPHLVGESGITDTKYKNINYIGVIPYLINSIKNINERLSALEKKLE